MLIRAVLREEPITCGDNSSIRAYIHNINEVKVLANMLSTRKSITSLDIRGYDIGHDIQIIFDAINQHRIALKSLCVSNFLPSLLSLAKFIESNTTIKELKLLVDDLTNDDWYQFQLAICRNNTLTSLSMTNNEFNDLDATCVGRSLQKNQGITFLDLSSNKIGDTGAKELAEIVLVNKYVIVLLSSIA